MIKFYEQVKTDNHCYYVYEYCNGGTLDDFILKKRFLNEKEALYYFRQMLNGCKALVENKIIHRDFKPANILLHNNIIKLADFGFCKRKSDIYDMNLTMAGSPLYMAPEILNGKTPIIEN